MQWKDKLIGSLERRTILCIGLDTDLEKFPPHLREGILPQFERNRELIDATAGMAAAYKLNQAFYEVQGIDGVTAMERTISYINREYPDVLVILDSKKGDIGNTSRAYARAAFEKLGAGSITVNAYMGKDAVIPFSEHKEKLVFVLCRTSNPAAGEVQNTPSPEEPLFLRMARMISGWNEHGNLGLVIGATYPEELRMVRDLVGFEMPVLVPGVGAQGGDLNKVLQYGTDPCGGGLLINVSRGIMFSFLKSDLDYITSASKAVGEYTSSINRIMKDLRRW
ncbi:MAG: orotidine-5'-phosphate decarboxylase [Candidatus Thermoplasmatota archaeon]|nr:orotidine-5'-phosphate decarboxylase [Candidatus Thermoplasmatota archaeon]